MRHTRDFKLPLMSLLLLLLTITSGSAVLAQSNSLFPAWPKKNQEPGSTIIKNTVPIGRGLKVDIHAPLTTKRRGLFRPGKKVPVLLYVHGFRQTYEKVSCIPLPKEL